METEKIGFNGGVGCAVTIGVSAAGLWGMYLLITSAINNLVQTRAEYVRAQAESSILYAQARQMDMVTGAAQAMVAQGQALPWLMALVIVIILAVLVWLVVEQRRQQRAVQQLLQRQGVTSCQS
jgi:type IV secretory pathway TrbD component